MFEVPVFDDLNAWAALPIILLALGTSILLVADLFIPEDRKRLTASLALGGVTVSLVVAMLQALGVEIGEQGAAFADMFIADQFTYVVNVIALSSAFIGILVSYDYFERAEVKRGEYYSLLLFSTMGAMLMGASRNLVMIFVALELLSIPLYLLSAFRKPIAASEESALKYFLLGAFSSGFLVYGITLLYGATGTFDIDGIWTAAVEIIDGEISRQFTLIAGFGLVIVGLGFKVGAVPFHGWQPDVYQGAPTPVTAFMSVTAKTGGFAAMLRVLVAGIPVVVAEDIAMWQDTIQVIALLTLVLGNFVAIMQDELKRMLAYSSIAHAGYLLIAVAAGGTEGIGDQAAQSALIYLLAYTFTNIGAFAVVVAMEHVDYSGTKLNDLKGLSNTNPMLAAVMALFMFSLTGIPGTAGFVGKWFVFKAAIDADLVLLAVVGVLTSVVSAFYYLRVVVNMYMEPGTPETQPETPSLRWALGITAAGTLILGILPYFMTELAEGVTVALIR
ncbi:MAG: NADH-quinone oxidoreductase subunit N [Chloroflexi bacterium]|nr:NADH-quinone oxidoreductase subunit N [Chloroflexota bacterium]